MCGLFYDANYLELPAKLRYPMGPCQRTLLHQIALATYDEFHS